MKTNNKLIFKSLFLNKERTFTTILMIIVIVATFTGIAVMYESGMKGIQNSIVNTSGDFDVKVKDLDSKYTKKDIEKLDVFKDIEMYDVISSKESEKQLAEYNKIKNIKNKDEETEKIASIETLKFILENQNMYNIIDYTLYKEDENTKQKIDKKYINKARTDKTKNLKESVLSKAQFTLYGINNVDENQKLNGAELLSGRYPKNENEIIINDSNFIYKREFNINDTITIQDGNDKKKFKIVGIFKEKLGKQTDGIVAITNVQNSSKKYNKMFIAKYINVKKEPILTQTKKALSKLGYVIKDKDTEHENTDKKEAEKENYDVLNGKVEINDTLLELKEANRGKLGSKHKEFNFILIIRNALIIIVGVLASIIVYNGFNMSVVEKKKQYGILKSIGMTKKQIYVMVVKEAMILAVFGIILGLLFGILGDYVTIKIINNKIEELFKLLGGYETFSLIFSINLNAIIIVLIATFILIIISSLIPAIRASKTSAIDVIKGIDDYKIKTRKVKTSKVSKKIFGYKFDLARKNMKRVKSKFRIATISLTVSFILIFTIGTINFMLNTQINKISKKTQSFLGNDENLIGSVITSDKENEVDTKGIIDKTKTKLEKDLNRKISGNILLEYAYNDILEGKETEIFNQSYLKFVEKNKQRIIAQKQSSVEKAREEVKNDKEQDFTEELTSPKLKAINVLTSKINNKNLETVLAYDKYKEKIENKKVNIGYINTDTLTEEFKNKYNLKDLKNDEIKIADKVTINDKKLDKEYTVLKRQNNFELINFSASNKKLKTTKIQKNKVEFIDDINANLIENSSENSEILPSITIYVNNEVYNNIINNRTKSSQVLIVIKNKNDGSKTKTEQLKEVSENIKKSPIEYTTKDGNIILEQVMDMQQIIDIFKILTFVFRILIFGFLILMILMAIINIFANISINILLRSKELAILQSIGMTKKNLGQMLRYENYILSIKSIIYGIVISLVIIYGLLKFGIYKEQQLDVLAVFDFISLKSLIAAIFIIIVITLISTLYAKKKISRQDIIEVVRKENI
ncbi:MAG: ABC transporter permease [Clostridium sp.]